MIRTRSPIAASAVPRLMAVVVLPTPPFWLAIARTRGRAPRLPRGRERASRSEASRSRSLGHGTRASASANAQDRGLRVDDALKRFDCIRPASGSAAIWSLADSPRGNTPVGAALEPWSRQFERERQGGEGARGHGVHRSEAFGVDRFDPHGVDGRGRPCCAGRLAQESAFALVAFDAMDDRAGDVGQRDRDAPGPESPRPSPCRPIVSPPARAREAAPKSAIWRVQTEAKVASAMRLVLRSPAVEQVDEDGQALLCFT